MMQVTPEAGRDTAKRFGLTYDWSKMVSDPVYNTQMGAAELSALFSEYRGNQIMTFAGYNAGRGRVREWVQTRGDPRDPNVDPVDWVERIPLSETRNYVQRVMENVLVYRTRFEGSGMVAVAGKSDQRVVTQGAGAAAPVAAAAPAP
jgi:soluble lytic murein transglycosylase